MILAAVTQHIYRYLAQDLAVIRGVTQCYCKAALGCVVASVVNDLTSACIPLHLSESTLDSMQALTMISSM